MLESPPPLILRKTLHLYTSESNVVGNGRVGEDLSSQTSQMQGASSKNCKPLCRRAPRSRSSPCCSLLKRGLACSTFCRAFCGCWKLERAPMRLQKGYFGLPSHSRQLQDKALEALRATNLRRILARHRDGMNRDATRGIEGLAGCITDGSISIRHRKGKLVIDPRTGRG
jgi:hypothetical protein